MLKCHEKFSTLLKTCGCSEEVLHGHKNTAVVVFRFFGFFFYYQIQSQTGLYILVGTKPQTGWQTTYVATRAHKPNVPCMHMESAVHILSHTLEDEKMEWEEVKGIEWVAVGEKDGERGRGRVGVSGTWLSG